MEIFVDNEPYCPRDPAPLTIDELIAQIKPELSDNDRMIVTIACDHKEIAEHEIDEVLGREIAGYQRLDFTTAAVSELATGAMQTAMTILSATRTKQTEAIELLSKDRNEEAINVLSECITGWVQTHDTVVKTVSLVGLNIDDLTHDGKNVIAILNEVAHHLTQLKECLAAGDYVLLNDLLQYEIVPWFDQWEGMVGAIANEVRATVAS
ncbi:MAG: hypothetical protein IIB58_06055 [Planctomycetes bacterium]|nr:hypothetical protein [Planctomycetota bacterium]